MDSIALLDSMDSILPRGHQDPPRKQPEATRRHPGSTQEAPRKHPGGTQEAPKKHPEAPRAPRKLQEALDAENDVPLS